MPRHRLHAGLLLIALAWGTSWASAGTDTITSTSKPVAGYSGDSSDHPKFYTLTASLREEYDDNIFTSKTNKQGSFKTDFSPSVLVDFPMDQGEFSARYTFGLQYYTDRPGNAIDLSHEFDALFRHSFSERFSLDMAELFRYYTEPSLFQSTGTPYRSGAYIANTVNSNFNASWTPLISTVTSYSNTIVKYENDAIAKTQDSIEHTGSQSIGFAILPKITLNFGGIIDDISYDDITRGYTNYTGYTGATWQTLPSLSISGSIGGSVTDTANNSSSVSPYGALSIGWKLGERSSLTFNYLHNVVPTDLFTSDGQIADRFSALFHYDITTNLAAHLQGILTHGEYNQDLTIAGGNPSFSENDFAIDTGLTYHYSRYLDFDVGYTFSGISSDVGFRDYTRNQAYVGIRGTY